MAKTLIGNIKGKDGRGISKIDKTATTGSVDTYTIAYTDGTKSTYEVKNSDSVAIQRQIVPSAAVESSSTASQAYAAGDYVVVGGVLRKVKSSITKGSTIGDSNSTATTVTGEINTVRDSVSQLKNDYVVEQGVKSGWQYVKWASGRAECSCAVKTVITQTGNYWLPEVSLPFAFKKPANSYDKFSVFVSGCDYFAPIFYSEYPISKSVVNTVCCAAENAKEKGTTTINYIVRGYWK